MCGPMGVSTNLWNALQRLRDEQHAVDVWVDSICIDQQNYVERSAQVNIMAQIFNQAGDVRVWLGEVPIEGTPHVTDAELFLELCQQPSPWWKRIWILQETAYSKKCPTLMLGAQILSFERLNERWNGVIQSNDELDEKQRTILEDNLEYLRFAFSMWTEQTENHGHRLSLWQRLGQTAGRQCSDARDRIYALLSLVNEDEAKHLPPNYRKPYSELVVEVADILDRSISLEPRACCTLVRLLRPDPLIAMTLLPSVGRWAYASALMEVRLESNRREQISAALNILRRPIHRRSSWQTEAFADFIAPESTVRAVTRLLADLPTNEDHGPALTRAI